MSSLNNLSNELLETIFLAVDDVEDVISLGASSSSLTRILGQERIWRLLFSRTELVEEGVVMEARLGAIKGFLTSLPNNTSLFSMLHLTIAQRHPAEVKESITVSFPGDPQLHQVSGLGLQLLALAGREGARLQLNKVKVGRLSPSLLLFLASLQGEQVTELEVDDIIFCSSEEKGTALGSIMEKCSRWRVGGLMLYGEVGGQTWEGLGRAAARGRLGYVPTKREVLRRGRREELLAVWGSTETCWTVDEEDMWRSDGEEAWGRIEEIML